LPAASDPERPEQIGGARRANPPYGAKRLLKKKRRALPLQRSQAVSPRPYRRKTAMHILAPLRSRFGEAETFDPADQM